MKSCNEFRFCNSQKIQEKGWGNENQKWIVKKYKVKKINPKMEELNYGLWRNKYIIQTKQKKTIRNGSLLVCY